MSKVLYIIFISLFSLTVISCSSKDDDSSSTSTTASDDTTTTANTCPAENWWQLMEGSTSRNVSLFAPRTLNRHSEQGSGRVLYVIKPRFLSIRREITIFRLMSLMQISIGHGK